MVRVLVALGIAIVVGAAALPVSSVGIGWLIAALAMLGVAVAARTARGTVAEPTPTPAPQPWTTLPPIEAPPVAAPAVAPLPVPSPETPTPVLPALNLARQHARDLLVSAPEQPCIGDVDRS
jgi:hypothetical protein